MAPTGRCLAPGCTAAVLSGAACVEADDLTAAVVPGLAARGMRCATTVHVPPARGELSDRPVRRCCLQVLEQKFTFRIDVLDTMRLMGPGVLQQK